MAGPGFQIPKKRQREVMSSEEGAAAARLSLELVTIRTRLTVPLVRWGAPLVTSNPGNALPGICGHGRLQSNSMTKMPALLHAGLVSSEATS